MASARETDLTIAEQIPLLREVTDAPRRGYLFEQALREIVPWCVRPPLAVSVPTASEQLDCFFEWNSWHFLMEAKAKQGKLHRGSHEWEDFELKVRKREGNCIGLFCSLYEVDPQIAQAAVQLNERGITTIVLTGRFWDDLADSYLSLEHVLRYMVLHARAKFISEPPPIQEIQAWCTNRETAESRILAVCRAASATFLRRTRLARHSELYVPRALDETIANFANNLLPSRLGLTSKRHRRKKTRLEYTTTRVRPPQICVIRDMSGAGKTTTSVQIALTSAPFFGIGRAALESDVDDLVSRLDRAGSAYGLLELQSVDKPIVFAVDSLDEARAIPQKDRQILSLLKSIEELNEAANERGLLMFPIGIIFTVRDDYWQPWQTLFEGRKIVTYLMQFSNFTSKETTDALERYSRIFSFTTNGKLTQDARRVLALPFNLQVFSEANEYRDGVRLDDIFDENVLGRYFVRKREEILKRSIVGLDSSKFMRLLASVAMDVVTRNENLISKAQFSRCVQTMYPLLQGFSDDIFHLMISEQIVLRDSELQTLYRFRHSRFIEFLAAYAVVIALADHADSQQMEAMKCFNLANVFKALTSKIIESKISSIYRVYLFVRHICLSEFQELYDNVLECYSQSEEFLVALLRRARGRIAVGLALEEADLVMIQKSASRARGRIAFDIFFALAAKANNLPRDQILTAFSVAWDTYAHCDRWKLIAKVCDRGFAVDERILTKLITSDSAKEWEVYLSCILESHQEATLRQYWSDCLRRVRANFKHSPDGKAVQRLIACVLDEKRYEIGIGGD